MEERGYRGRQGTKRDEVKAAAIAVGRCKAGRKKLINAAQRFMRGAGACETSQLVGKAIKCKTNAKQ